MVSAFRQDGCVYLWDTHSRLSVRRIHVARLQNFEGGRPVDMLPTRQWPTGKGEVLRCRAVSFDSSGTKLAVATGSDSGRSGVYSGPSRANGRPSKRSWSHDLDKGGVVRLYSVDEAVLTPPHLAGGLPDAEMDRRVIFEVKISKEGIDTIQFSPDGRYLAAGSHDNFLYHLSSRIVATILN